MAGEYTHGKRYRKCNESEFHSPVHCADQKAGLAPPSRDGTKSINRSRLIIFRHTFTLLFPIFIIRIRLSIPTSNER